ncbi:MAG: phosphoribosylanthranilate isomerase, partial [Nitrospirota bacterium]
EALGFVFFKESPRCINPEAAKDVISSLPPNAMTVGVFVDAPRDVVLKTVKTTGIRMLQFHGSEKPDYCSSFGLPFVKAFRVRRMESLEEIRLYSKAYAFLLDAYSETGFGGTGMVFNWDFAIFAKRFGRIILAGGLTPDNIAGAVRYVMPYAVDVSSGVEAAKGKKDHEAVRLFIERAKAAVK